MDSLSLIDKVFNRQNEKGKYTIYTILEVLFVLFYGLGDVVTTLLCQVYHIPENNPIYKYIFSHAFNSWWALWSFLSIKISIILIMFSIIELLHSPKQKLLMLGCLVLYGFYLTLNNTLNLLQVF